MRRGKASETKDPEFRVANKSMKLKLEIISIAKSHGLTYSQFIRQELIKLAESYPESKKHYSDNDDGN